jgi:hypothetical protein
MDSGDGGRARLWAFLYKAGISVPMAIVPSDIFPVPAAAQYNSP